MQEGSDQQQSADVPDCSACCVNKTARTTQGGFQPEVIQCALRYKPDRIQTDQKSREQNKTPHVGNVVYAKFEPLLPAEPTQTVIYHDHAVIRSNY